MGIFGEFGRCFNWRLSVIMSMFNIEHVFLVVWGCLVGGFLMIETVGFWVIIIIAAILSFIIAKLAAIFTAGGIFAVLFDLPQGAFVAGVAAVIALVLELTFLVLLIAKLVDLGEPHWEWVIIIIVYSFFILMEIISIVVAFRYHYYLKHDKMKPIPKRKLSAKERKARRLKRKEERRMEKLFRKQQQS